MGIEHKITLASDFPADDVLHPMLTALPQFTEYDTEYGLHDFGTNATAVTVSIESDGFLVCDHLVDRELARKVLDSLITGIKELDIKINDVSEV
ncbi:hypothetical protein CA13_09200 [Planctomycetes bacterium CA13]|uniref:Uncharacterized protein n=1 Tax=Novipirellula herctigrandis TaxID=2527986 RepID=A0A5C5YXM0_9BACT|nr:hypothetical protein CA13_09200 [Planctomycetes bacterium CA13]